MVEHDVVIIGGGHNGLIVAAYMAKAGLDVCVVEKDDKVGGGVITKELTLPGFKHDPGSVIHELIQANPLIRRDELELISKYGLRYITPDPQAAIIFPDDRALIIYRDIDRTCESISQFSKRDADNYQRYCQAIGKMLSVARVALFSPPPSYGTMISFLDSSEEGREFLRMSLSSASDIATEWFESREMKTAFLRWTSESMVGPREKGTGNNTLGWALFHSHGYAMAEGGAGALSEALAACIRDNGGTIRVSSPVKMVKVEEGEAKGVILESGEEILAKRATISAVNVKQLFLEMVEPKDLPPDFPEKVKRLKHSTFALFNQAFALNEAPKFKAGDDVSRVPLIQITPYLEDLIRIYDEYAYGIPSVETPLLVTATLVDPTRAPQGKHTLYLLQQEPYDLRDGGPEKWDDIKQEVADGVLETARRHTTNLGPENILGRWIGTPLDCERENSAMIHGDIHHIGTFIDQYFGNRPLPGWGHYKTPVQKLYMCGASTHPGPGVSGGGRAAVQTIMEDLGLDFRKVIPKRSK